MTIMASTLAQAINECRHVTPEELTRDTIRAAAPKLFPYRISLMLYSGLIETHYIKAANRSDAFDKAHRFANPIAASGRDGVQFINTTKLTKAYCEEHHITFE